MGYQETPAARVDARECRYSVRLNTPSHANACTIHAVDPTFAEAVRAPGRSGGLATYIQLFDIFLPVIYLVLPPIESPFPQPL